MSLTQAEKVGATFPPQPKFFHLKIFHLFIITSGVELCVNLTFFVEILGGTYHHGLHCRSFSTNSWNCHDLSHHRLANTFKVSPILTTTALTSPLLCLTFIIFQVKNFDLIFNQLAVSAWAGVQACCKSNVHHPRNGWQRQELTSMHTMWSE